MTRESRDPLSVLRASAARERMDGNGHHARRMEEAIARVEALVDAAGYMLASSYRGPDQDGLIVALAPFTPTDSEGCGHG